MVTRHAGERLLLIGWALTLSVAAWADPLPPQAYWDEVKAALKQGAYREALQALDALQTLAPDDPRVPLYRTLCERRLQSPTLFRQLTPEELSSLKGRLEQEATAQRRAVKQHEALERQLRREQARWDKELERLEREATQQRARERRQVQAEAVQRARAERIAEREQVQRETIARLAAAPPAAEQPLPRVTGVTAPPVELAPVTVPTIAVVPPEPTSPSLVGRPPPPRGAVQINASQMSMSPDRKVAVAEGDVEVVFENALLTADHMTLFTDTNDVYAEGRVRLEQGTQVFRGEMAHYNFNNKKGRFLQGTVSSPPWYEHGRSVEHIAEGVYQVTPGYLTSCDHEPPHFKFYGRRATVFSDDKLARARNVALVVERVPFLYLPWLTVADRQSPFFFIPGKRKPWGQFALMGYRYELPGLPGTHKGSYKLDWRRYFGWAVGMDHRFESPQLGKGLLKFYYNEEANRTEPRSALPKGADVNRYRVLWRHAWQPMPDTSVVTDLQEYSDVNFRKELLFKEEFTDDDVAESFISTVTSTPAYTLSTLTKKRLNRFQTVTEALPEVTMDVREARIGESNLFSRTTLGVANLQTVNAHSETDTDVVRVDWFQQLKYALGLFRPIEVTPRAGIRQTYYTKDKQASESGLRDVISGQASLGADASLKLFRVVPVVSNVLGLNLNGLRHVLTPTVGYSYVHQPTVPNDLLNFASADSPTNQFSFGIENKLQTRRPVGQGQLQSVDLARMLLSIPYTFHGHGNKQGGRLGDLAFDLELYPWPWLRVESDWKYPSHFVKGTRDSRVTGWNVDLAMVGGRGTPKAVDAPDIQAPAPQGYQPGPRGGVAFTLPEGQWALGLGHRYSQNDKTEDVVQFDWRLSNKWQVNTFHRYTWKEVAGGSKRFRNVREYQYALRRDLHDWVAEFVYRVDREFGEEVFLTLTLKAYPELPVELETSYHQPKMGSQSSPFSPVQR